MEDKLIEESINGYIISIARNTEKQKPKHCNRTDLFHDAE